MNAHHRMVLESDNGTDLLFTCPHEGCGRRLVFSRSGEMTVLEQGDFFALHSGGTLEVSAELGGLNQG